MFERFRTAFPVGEDEWKDYTGRFHQTAVPAKTTLLKEGEVSKKLFLVEQGCLRVWFNNNGRDLTLQFFFENNVVASIESLRKNVPSPVSIETVEPSVLWYVHKADIDVILAGINTVPALRDLFIDAVFERTFGYMKQFFSFIKDKPLQRYRNLLEEKPEIIKRVPQHYIASYLGISAVHLSRIKSGLAKKRRMPI